MRVTEFWACSLFTKPLFLWLLRGISSCCLCFYNEINISHKIITFFSFFKSTYSFKNKRFMLVNIVYVVKTLQKFSYYVWNTKTKILPRFFFVFHSKQCFILGFLICPKYGKFWSIFSQNMANFEVVFLPRQLHFSINIISLISEMCGIQ